MVGKANGIVIVVNATGVEKTVLALVNDDGKLEEEVEGSEKMVRALVNNDGKLEEEADSEKRVPRCHFPSADPCAYAFAQKDQYNEDASSAPHWHQNEHSNEREEHPL